MTAVRRGFTLVEVLVALVIMAVVAAMGWQGVSGMARAREIATAASERTLLRSCARRFSRSSADRSSAVSSPCAHAGSSA